MDLNFEVNGNGKPIVLLHGGGADLRDWTYIAPLLSKNYKVISFDARGVGKSPSPSGQVSYVEDLKNLIDYFEFEETMLIGHSIGGQIATDFTLDYPDRVTKLVLIAPALSGFQYSKQFADYMQSINEVAPDIDKMVEISTSAPLYRIVRASTHRDLWLQMQRHYMKRTLEWPAFEMIWPQPPAFQRLEKLTTETFFLIGKEELLDNHRVADCFRRIPAVRVVEISNADHMMTLTHPKKLTHLITAFMEDDFNHAENTGRE